MNEEDRHILFSELIARHHSQLYAYIFAVVKSRDDAEDLFQSVCLVLWRKFESFAPDSSFFAWARQTAKLVLCSFLRHKKNMSKLASEELLDALAETVSKTQGDGVEPCLAALQRCRKKLTDSDEQLLRLRYDEDLGVGEIADRLRRLPPNVCRSLNRIRHWLLECIRIELAHQDHPRGSSHE
jgi:RNA polymerase sigma-70 factor, ECF subfamily